MEMGAAALIRQPLSLRLNSGFTKDRRNYAGIIGILG